MEFNMELTHFHRAETIKLNKNINLLLEQSHNREDELIKIFPGKLISQFIEGKMEKVFFIF